MRSSLTPLPLLLLTFLAILLRIAVDFIDRMRIRHAAQTLGWSELTLCLDPYGPGWLLPFRQRNYLVRYRDPDGILHSQYCVTCFFQKVYWSSTDGVIPGADSTLAHTRRFVYWRWAAGFTTFLPIVHFLTAITLLSVLTIRDFGMINIIEACAGIYFTENGLLPPFYLNLARISLFVGLPSLLLSVIPAPWSRIKKWTAPLFYLLAYLLQFLPFLICSVTMLF